MNLATKITVSRIFLIIPAMIFYILAYYISAYFKAFLIVSLIIYIVLSLTDVLDGMVARKTNTVSDFGKFLDPLADKVVVVVMLFLLVWQSSKLDTAIYPYGGLIFAILSGIVISRELIIGIFRAIASQKGVVLAADVFGKIKTQFLNTGVSILIIAPLWIGFYWIGQVCFYVGAFFAVFSGIRYVVNNKQVFDDDSKEKDESIQ